MFQTTLDGLLAEADFDAWIEQLCELNYSNGKGQPGTPPGLYFRMLPVGYFEGIHSQRGIAGDVLIELTFSWSFGGPQTRLRLRH